jgi:hypothetical protein
MRCPECGHSLVGTPDGAPCTECGVASAAPEREPGPMPTPGRLVLRFGWPAMAGIVSIVVNWLCNLTRIAGVDEVLVTLGIVAIVLFLFVGPLNTATQTRLLMNRLPRRVRTAPLLALIPRNVMVPILAGIATVPVNIAIGFGACVGALVLGGGRIGG